MDFETNVIEESKQVPVLVDFWAPWCGPCKFLGPVLEDLASKSEDWKLVKVNTDEQPQLSAQFGIRGIPAVKLFVDGEVKAEFTGALPKHQVQRWLKTNLPDERQKEFDEIVSAGDRERLMKFVETNPDFDNGIMELASQLALTDPVKAFELVSEKIAWPIRFDLESIKELYALDEDETIINKKLLDARRSLQSDDLDAGLAELIEAVTIEKSHLNELPRRLVVAIFNLLGPGHELTLKYRRKFDMVLY